MATEKKDPSKPSSAHLKMQPRIELMNAVNGGTETLRAKAKEFLQQHDGESDHRYQDRLAKSHTVNYFRRALESLVGKVFSKPIKIEDDMPPELVAITENIDLQGNNLDTFARTVFSDALLKGLTHVLVEYPVVDSAEVQTAADEQAIGASPYFVHIAPENLLAAYCEYANGREILTHVRIYEEEIQRVGFEEQLICRVRVLEPGKWELWKQVDKEWVLEDFGETTLNYIPLLTFYAEREEFMVARPPLTDLAHLNVAHYQNQSDQTNILTVARFPILAGSGLNEDEQKVKVGPRQLLVSSNENGKYYYLEHTGAAIEAGRQSLLDLKEEMATMGVELLKKPGNNVTATAKAIDTAENTSALQDLANRFKDALEQAFTFAADWLGNGVRPGSLRINTDFGLKVDSASDISALAAARTSRDISRTAYLKELQRRNVLSEDFNEEDDAEILMAEQQAALADQLFADAMAADAEANIEDPNAQ